MRNSRTRLACAAAGTAALAFAVLGAPTAQAQAPAAHASSEAGHQAARASERAAQRAADPSAVQAGLHIEGDQVVEGNGNPFVMRGVSHPYTWFPDENQSFSGIDSLGANTVRVVLGSGQRWDPDSVQEVSEVVSLCKENQLICVLEVHDTTGYGEQEGAATLQEAVDYWVSVQEALQGQEDYVIINIGNEPIGNNNAQQWVDATANAVERMRAEGFEHLLMVDAPNWGQDWEQVMLNNAETVAAADPQGNTVFSIHMYGVYEQAQTIIDYLDGFQQLGLPLVIGEFGHQHSDGDPDEDTIMAEAESRGLGYIGWSFSGNTDPILDMTVDFDASQLTDWGERVFNGPDGIAETAEKATVYTNTGGR